jgi:hypothetical protein
VSQFFIAACHPFELNCVHPSVTADFCYPQQAVQQLSQLDIAGVLLLASAFLTSW